MFIRRSTYHRLIARADSYAHDARTARREEQNAHNEVARLAALADVRQTDHDKTVASLSAELAQRDRAVARLQARLDNAVGLDDPALDLGAQWQQRRTDKPALSTAKGDQ